MGYQTNMGLPPLLARSVWGGASAEYACVPGCRTRADSVRLTSSERHL
jgi:hypothetical protein